MHGVFLRNSNAMDVILGPGYITYRVTGGVLDFYIVLGDSPEDAVQQYHNVIGLPAMPPLWSLGFHQCRWGQFFPPFLSIRLTALTSFDFLAGYNNLSDVIDVVKNYTANQLPLSAIWNDIDYMQNYLDFTTDPIRYPLQQVQRFVSEINSRGLRYVQIVDPAIWVPNSTNFEYPVYDSGLHNQVFIRDATGNTFTGSVWPGLTAFPDFVMSSVAQQWWYQQIVSWVNTTGVSGIWIDMNEPSSFCTGECSTPQPPSQFRVAQADFDELKSSALDAHERNQKRRINERGTRGQMLKFDPNNPPYRINNAGNGSPLNTRTIDADAVHGLYNGQNNQIHYNVHNLYGLSEGIVTAKAVAQALNQRPFVLSRSTFAGSGAHHAHWEGDNFSQWWSMAQSIADMLTLNMYGIPLVGGDICGFLDDTTEELCGRWMQLGAFYPFSRNHNGLNSIPQEPYQWPSVAAISRQVLGARYSLIHYLSTQFFSVNQIGGTVARPLFFEFPTDPLTLAIDEQFMLGPALLISPVLTQGATTVNAYLPPASRWFSFWDNTEQHPVGAITLPAPFDTIQVHQRGGFILPIQTPALNTDLQMLNPFEYRAALDQNGQAVGSLFLDDGVDRNVGANALLVNFAVSGQSFSASVSQSTYAKASSIMCTRVTIVGVLSSQVSGVTINGQTVARGNWSWDSLNSILSVTLSQPVTAGFSLQWI